MTHRHPLLRRRADQMIESGQARLCAFAHCDDLLVALSLHYQREDTLRGRYRQWRITGAQPSSDFSDEIRRWG